MNLLHHGVRKFEVQLNSTDAAGLFEEWGFQCCGLSFGRPTRERPAAVFRERLGVDGRLDFLPPVPTRYLLWRFIMSRRQMQRQLRRPPNRCPKHTISHYITDPLQGQRDLIAAYPRPKVLCHLFPHTVQVFNIGQLLLTL